MEKIYHLLFTFFFSLFLFSFFELIPQNTEAAVARALVKEGDKFEFPVAGKLLVKRKTKKTGEEQYLWAGTCDGQQSWTTDGVSVFFNYILLIFIKFRKIKSEKLSLTGILEN